MTEKRTYRLGKKLLLFLVIVVGINSVISLWYYKKVAPKTLLYRTDLKYEENKSTTNTLFVGHSRAQLGINDSLFDNTVNIASYGENNVYTYYKLNKILNDPNNKIQTVIIPNGFGSFSSLKNPAICDHTYWNKYIDYAELGGNHDDRERYVSELVQSKLFPYVRTIQKGINKKFKFDGREKLTLHQLKTEQEKVAYATKAITVNFINRNCYDDVAYAYLQKTIRLCEAKKVNVITVKYPITSYYFAAVKSVMGENDWNHERFDSLINSQNYRMFDFEDLYFERDDLFKDTHHLNKFGQKEFSKIIKENLYPL